MKDGVYINLPEEEYHAVEALSASGIKNILVNPMCFWANSWMNPLKEDGDDSEARIIGKAYHKRILEGREAFYSQYAHSFTPPSSCVKTIDDLKEALEACGVKPKGNKPALIKQLIEADPSVCIYDQVKSEYDSFHEGKEQLSTNMINKIELSASMIEMHPYLNKCFKGGYPEVSVIWTEDGVRLKSRFDYLKTKAIVDLKTFANFMNKPIDAAIYSAMAASKYHIQMAFYSHAVEVAKQLITDQDGFDKDWVEKFRQCEEHDFFFVFQLKGVAPIAKGKRMPKGTIYQCGCAAVEQGIRLYKENMEKYGTDPWVDDSQIDDFEDLLFPQYTTEL